MTDYIVLPGHAGVDEAGRGCLVGSVFAAAVMLPAHYDLPGLTDSKKLSEAKRDALAAQIKRQVTAWAVASASPAEIQRLNILHATMLAMRRAASTPEKNPRRTQDPGRVRRRPHRRSHPAVEPHPRTTHRDPLRTETRHRTPTDRQTRPGRDRTTRRPLRNGYGVK